jgi:hypothetical protein
MDIQLTPFTGVVWRIMFSDQEYKACESVSSPIGRFHHSEQPALYTSCTEEGAGIALKRYLKSDDPARIIVPLQVSSINIYDIRGTDFSSKASVVWQDCVAKGESAPTWSYSDKARAAGAQGLLYASRSRPDLTHLVLFDVSAKTVSQAGNSKAWHNYKV